MTYDSGFIVPYGAGSQLPIVVVAQDYNGHTSTVNFVLYSGVSCPQVVIDDPGPGETTHYSPNADGFSPQRVHGFVHPGDAQLSLP